jgi:hypothetical protein
MYECRDALDKGKEDDVTIFEYIKSGIEREYGKKFYKELKDKFVKKDA